MRTVFSPRAGPELIRDRQVSCVDRVLRGSSSRFAPWPRLFAGGGFERARRGRPTDVASQDECGAYDVSRLDLSYRAVALSGEPHSRLRPFRDNDVRARCNLSESLDWMPAVSPRREPSAALDRRRHDDSSGILSRRGWRDRSRHRPLNPRTVVGGSRSGYRGDATVPLARSRGSSILERDRLRSHPNQASMRRRRRGVESWHPRPPAPPLQPRGHPSGSESASTFMVAHARSIAYRFQVPSCAYPCLRACASTLRASDTRHFACRRMFARRSVRTLSRGSRQQDRVADLRAAPDSCLRCARVSAAIALPASLPRRDLSTSTRLLFPRTVRDRHADPPLRRAGGPSLPPGDRSSRF